MPERQKDWLEQARYDLEHARLAAREGHFEWAAFAAMQAAEKACKALHLSLGTTPWAHDVTVLLEGLSPQHRPPPDLVQRAKGLDRHYLNARYPTMFAAGTPRENYTQQEADQALADSEAIIAFCRGLLPA